jgi:uncharacterized alpha-E superfamily protein
MLSRVAELLMWTSRYMERADALARIVEVVDQLALDFVHPSLTDEQAFWDPLLASYSLLQGNEHLSHNDKIHLLTLDRSSLISVYSCVAATRFNARGIRDQLLNEVWELINELYLWCNRKADKWKDQRNLSEFGSKVKFSALCYRGIIETMIGRTEAWAFLHLGSRLERADQISRLVDMKHYMISGKNPQEDMLEPYAHFVIMSSSGSREHGRANTSGATWSSIVNRLVFDVNEPCSIRSNVQASYEVLKTLSRSSVNDYGSTLYHIGKLKAHLDSASFSTDAIEDLQQFLDGIQVQLIQVSKAVAVEFGMDG